jgi:predicted RNA-binding protein associated with RNAse of E/G family
LSETLKWNHEKIYAVRYPGYKMVQQSLDYEKGKPYDILEIITADGKNKKVYFDISNFFGKM